MRAQVDSAGGHLDSVDRMQTFECFNGEPGETERGDPVQKALVDGKSCLVASTKTNALLEQ